MARKVLIYAPLIGRGGVARMITRLAQAWDQADGWEFIVLSQKMDENGGKIDWPVEFIQIDGGKPPAHPYLFGWLYKNQEKFFAHWGKIKADLTYLPMPWWVARFPGFYLPMPTVATIHDFAWDQMGQPNHEFRAEARIFAQTDVFGVFPSNYQRQWGETHYGFRRAKTIYHGHFIPKTYLATPFEADRVRKKYELPERYTLAFHIANDKKDPLTILHGQLLARRANPNVPPLVIAGLDTEWFAPPFVNNQHHAATFVRKIVDMIQWCGFVYGQDLFVLGNVDENDISGLYAGATAAITATRNEGGISGTMFEAFAAHTPCIYTDLEVFSERLTPHQFGFVFQAGDATSLANCIVQACTKSDEAFRRAANAFAFANDRTWEDAAAEYLNLFETILEG